MGFEERRMGRGECEDRVGGTALLILLLCRRGQTITHEWDSGGEVSVFAYFPPPLLSFFFTSLFYSPLRRISAPLNRLLLGGWKKRGRKGEVGRRT